MNSSQSSDELRGQSIASLRALESQVIQARRQLVGKDVDNNDELSSAQELLRDSAQRLQELGPQVTEMAIPVDDVSGAHFDHLPVERVPIVIAEHMLMLAGQLSERAKRTDDQSLVDGLQVVVEQLSACAQELEEAAIRPEAQPEGTETTEQASHGYGGPGDAQAAVRSSKPEQVV